MTHVEPDPAADRERYPSFRTELDTREYHVIGKDFAGSVPPQYGVAPQIRVGRTKWFNLLWLVPIGFVLIVAGITAAKGLRETSGVQAFIR